MNTTEHLKRIRARCVELLARFETDLRAGLYPSRAAQAGWHSTIAAIDGLLKERAELAISDWETEGIDEAITAILAAWPEELL